MDLPTKKATDDGPDPDYTKWTPRTEVLDQYGSVYEGRRTFHGYMAGSYALPNDGEEQSRLDNQHRLWVVLLQGKLHLAPIDPKADLSVLDVATGTGSWAIAFAKEHPRSQVWGTDLSLIQPPPPSNAQFVLTDSEDEDWLFPMPFDYVHFRCTWSSFNDLPLLIEKAHDSLTAGGYIEFHESTLEFHCDDGSFSGTAMEKWSNLVLDAFRNMGRDHRKYLRETKRMLEDAGFVDVVEKTIYIPTSNWGQEEKLHRSQGEACAATVMPRLIDAYSKTLEYAGLSAEEIEEVEDKARADVGNKDVRFYLPAYIVYGRKEG